VAVLTGIVLVALTGAGLERGASGHPGEVARHQPWTAPGKITTTLPAVPARRTGAVVPERPVTSRLPDGTVVQVRPVDTGSSGNLDVPDDIRVAGWWRGGSRVGDPFGAAVLAAHVDSFSQGLGPYASLLSVRPGERVALSSAHLTQTFAVVSLQLVPRGRLARHHEIFSARGPLRLVMITCAGPYEPAHGGYQNLAVVTATPTSSAIRRS
jgi:hypothetical protein